MSDGQVSHTATNRSTADPTRFHSPFEYDPEPTLEQAKDAALRLGREVGEFVQWVHELENESARQRGVIESQKSALHEWRRKSEEDAGRLKRYHAALFEIAFSRCHVADSKKDWRIAAGQIGGKAAAAAMTPEERTERARAAVQARWQRARGEDADVDRRQRLHAALFEIAFSRCHVADDDPEALRFIRGAFDHSNEARPARTGGHRMSEAVTDVIRIPRTLAPTHPYRIDFLDGTHIRFTTELCGARSACAHFLPMVNEQTKEEYSLEVCQRMVREWDRIPRENL